MKDLLPNKVCASPIMDFEQLCNNEMRIEDTIHSGRIEENEGKMSAPTKKVFKSSSKAPINTSAQANNRSVIRLIMVANPDKHPNLKGTSTH